MVYPLFLMKKTPIDGCTHFYDTAICHMEFMLNPKLPKQDGWLKSISLVGYEWDIANNFLGDNPKKYMAAHDMAKALKR